MLSLRREIERRRKEQQRLIKKLRRGNAESFEIGDEVRVQDTQSGQWRIKGVVSEVIEHNSSSSKTYKVMSDSGSTFLRNGKFIKLCLSRMRKKRVSWDPSVKGGL